MSGLMLLKIFSDCCVCFAILASGPIVFEVPLAIPAVICGVCAGFASFFEEKGWSGLRRICAALPFACLALEEGTMQQLFLAIPAGYTAVMIFTNKLELEYYAYRRFFLQSLALLGGVYLVANMWIFLTQITNDEVPILVPSVILRYGLVHLLCGIVLQRKLRLGVGTQAAGGRGQMAGFLGIIGAIIAGFAVAEPMLRQGIRNVMQAIVTLLFAPLYLLVELFSWLINLIEKAEDNGKDVNAFLEHMEAINTGLDGLLKPGYESQEPITIDVTKIWLIFVFTALAIVAVILFCSFRKRLAVADAGEVQAPVITTSRKKRVSRLSNRGKVRQAYRDFLRMQKNQGIKLLGSDTSEVILGKVHEKTDRDNAEQLREIYLAARYDERAQISREQVSLARNAAKNSVKQ